LNFRKVFLLGALDARKQRQFEPEVSYNAKPTILLALNVIGRTGGALATSGKHGLVAAVRTIPLDVLVATYAQRSSSPIPVAGSSRYNVNDAFATCVPTGSANVKVGNVPYVAVALGVIATAAIGDAGGKPGAIGGPAGAEESAAVPVSCNVPDPPDADGSVIVARAPPARSVA
jgi:hypothetical protein